MEVEAERRREREAAGRVLWVISYVKMKQIPTDLEQVRGKEFPRR